MLERRTQQRSNGHVDKNDNNNDKMKPSLFTTGKHGNDDKKKTAKGETKTQTQNNDNSRRRHVIYMSRFVLAMSVLTSITCGFWLGQMTRHYPWWNPRVKQPPQEEQVLGQCIGTAAAWSKFLHDSLAPPTVYTSKSFLNQDYCPSSSEEDDVTGHLLMVDMNGLSQNFLNSQVELANAIVNVAQDVSLTLKSYHCHSMVPAGVSCVGILLEGYIAFHTWPQEGVITLDLFVAAAGLESDTMSSSVLDMVTRYFGITLNDEPPTILWAVKARGFPEQDPTDLDMFIRASMGVETKQQLVKEDTEFQQVEIYNVVRHGIYNRIVHLDGMIQSTIQGDAPYHEALVHPAMFSHAKPQFVAIVGGGEGATLREVLKHKTVQKVHMIEIDKGMVDASRKHLPEWNDCSDLVGRSQCCFDDARTNMFYESAIPWFTDRDLSLDEDKNELLDVIIMDALDPSFDVPFSDELYTNLEFATSLYNSLSADGVLVIQTGEAPIEVGPPDVWSTFQIRHAMTLLLQDVGFEGIQSYHEAHCGFQYPWSFLVAFKSGYARSLFHMNAAQFEAELHSRGVETNSGKSPFRYFDGATMMAYQEPHKAFEAVFCKQDPVPPECNNYRGLDVSLLNAPRSAFEVKISGAEEKAGRGVFATRDIEKSAYIMLEESMDFVQFDPNTEYLLNSFYHGQEHSHALEPVSMYAYGYGFSRNVRGVPEMLVDSGILAFVNHGCNGTHNGDWGRDYSVDEDHVTLTEMTASPLHTPMLERSSVFNPVVDRHLQQFLAGKTLRNVRAGEEVLANYVYYCQEPAPWPGFLQDLRDQCMGKVGEISQYEEMHK